MCHAACCQRHDRILAIGFDAEFHPSRMVLMLAMTALSLGSGIVSPLCGSLMDKVPLRSLLTVGAALMVGGFLMLSLARWFIEVILVYGLFMAPASVLLGPIAATVLLSRWFDKRRGTALGIAVSGIALGAALFPLMIQALLASYDWRGAMRVLALIILCILIPAIAMIIDRPIAATSSTNPGAPSAKANQKQPQASKVTVRSIITHSAFWTVVGLSAVILSGMKGMVTNLVPLAVGEGISMDRAALLLSLNAACGFVGKLTFAAVADKLGLSRLVATSLAGYLAGKCCMIVAGKVYWAMAVAVGLIGMFGGMMIPIQGMLVSRLFAPHVIGKVSGLLNLAILCAMLLTPPIFGLIFDLSGSYDMIFGLFAVLAAIGLMVVPRIRMEPRIEGQEMPG
jgi:MFS family permease